MHTKTKKPVVLTILWVAAIVLAILLLRHNNPLEDAHTAFLKKACGCALLSVFSVILTVFYDQLTQLPVDLFNNRRLIWKLAKNDFRKRYAGSYLGVVWSMVPPLVQVVMYWFVFDRIFGSGPQRTSAGIDVPYVLFLTAGIVPWFFFTDALSGGTTALLEYNYLVKKVVFQISVLPIIKITAAVFVHVFFTGVLMIIAAMYGYYPSIYTVQLLYYTLCEYLFVLALCYATSAIVVFFRDLQQIIGVLMQIGIWATPILWNINTTLGDDYKWIIKLNPMTYIVEGYRSSIYSKQWFFEHFYSSTYFWIATALLFIISSLIFKKLKPQLADVM